MDSGMLHVDFYKGVILVNTTYGNGIGLTIQIISSLWAKYLRQKYFLIGREREKISTPGSLWVMTSFSMTV